MKHINPDVLKEIKKIDLLTYLMNYQPDRLKKISHDTHCIRDHPSLHISNGLWHWQSMGVGGRSALDFLIKVDNYSFLDAASILNREIENERTYLSRLFNKGRNQEIAVATFFKNKRKCN